MLLASDVLKQQHNNELRVNKKRSNKPTTIPLTFGRKNMYQNSAKTSCKLYELKVRELKDQKTRNLVWAGEHVLLSGLEDGRLNGGNS